MADDPFLIPPSAGEPSPFRPTFPEPEAPTAPKPPTEPTPEPNPEPEPPSGPVAQPGVTEPDSGALPGLDKLALLLLVLGLVLLANAITSFLNWMMRAVWPSIAGTPKQLDAQATTKALGSYLGTFAQTFDPEVGTNFTQMATTTGLLARTLVSLAGRLYHLAQVTATLEAHAAGQVDAVNALRHKVQVQDAAQVQTVKQLQTQEKRDHALEVGTAEELHNLQKHVTTVLEPELARLRSRIPDLEKGQAVTTKRVNQHEELLGLGAMTGTVAAAMARLGSTWTQCDNNQALGKAICQADSGNLRNLLRGLMPLIDIAALCGLVGVIAETGKSSVVIELLGVFSEGVEGLLACTGATVAPPLPIARPVLPPLTGWASLTPAHG